MIAEFRSIVGLADEHASFEVTHRVVGRRADQVTMRVRSVLELMGYLARGVQLPQEHIDEQRAVGANTPPDASRTAVPLRVLSSTEQPAGAYVAVRYGDHWFYLPHSDSDSKRAFGLLQYLFQMQAPQPQGGTPVITVPAG